MGTTEIRRTGRYHLRKIQTLTLTHTHQLTKSPLSSLVCVFVLFAALCVIVKAFSSFELFLILIY